MLRRSSTHTIDTDPTSDGVAAREVVIEPDDRLVGDHDSAVRPLPPPVAGRHTVLADPTDPVTISPVERSYVDRSYDERAAVEARVASQRFSLAAVLGAVAGVALLVVGIIAVLRGGLAGPIDEPVVQVLGFAHTPLLGLIDIAMGLLLLLAAASSSRSSLSFLGLVAVVAGAVAVAEPGRLEERLAVERSFGWVWLVAGAVIALAAWLLPVYERETRRIRTTDHVR